MIKISIIVTVYNKEKTIIRALDSIPKRDDIEVIVIDDCSTDNSWNLILNYDRIPLVRIKNTTNLGIGLTRNVGFDNARGEYLYALDGDDWLMTSPFNRFLDNWEYDQDVIHVGIEVNDGSVWGEGCCALHTMFIKRSFLGNKRCLDARHAEDYFLWEELKALSPKELNSDKCIYHYNWPNEGSLMWIRDHQH